MPHELPPPSAFRDVHFPGQQDGERVILLLRRHSFVFFITVVFFVLLTLLPVGLRLLFPSTVLTGLRGTAWEGIVLLAISAYYLFTWLFFTFAWVDYYLDLWIVTDERIVSVEQAGLFRRVISEQRLIRVQDVTSEVRGVFPTFLHYGQVFVQTAGERERFVFEQVPEPDLVKKVVLQAHEAAFKKVGGQPDATASVL